MIKSLLSVNNYYYLRGGAEKVFLDHNQLMEAEGWRVAPFAMQGDRNLESKWSDYFVKEIEFGQHEAATQKLVDAIKIIHSREAQHNIRKLINDFQPSIAHAHNIYHHLSTSILPEFKRAGVPLVMTLHDLKIACPAYTMLSGGEVCEKCRGGLHHVLTNRCMKESFLLSGLIMIEAYFNRLLNRYQNNVSRYVVPSQFYIDKLVDWGFPAEQFVHVPNFVALPLEPATQIGDYFVYAGRLSQEKGLPTLIKAIAQSRQKLLVAGTGPQEAEVKQLAEGLPNCDIRWLGYLDKKALVELVAGSRAVVVPSEWYENCPMAVIEAFAQGKPVIGSDIGGISEMIQQGWDGFKYRAGSVEELADLLTQMATMRPAQIAELGANARHKAATKYSKQQYTEKTLALYHQLLA